MNTEHKNRQLTTSRRLRISFSLMASICVLCGCSTTYKFKALPEHPIQAKVQRTGSLAVVVRDKREQTANIGTINDGFRYKLGVAVTEEKLENSLAKLFTECLEKVGYQVIPDAPIKLEADILQFTVESGGYTRQAWQKVSFALRNQNGKIMWQQTINSEEGGVLAGIDSVENGMRVALEKLLTQAVKEFSSELFAQCVNEPNNPAK